MKVARTYQIGKSRRLQSRYARHFCKGRITGSFKMTLHRKGKERLDFSLLYIRNESQS